MHVCYYIYQTAILKYKVLKYEISKIGKSMSFTPFLVVE